MDRFDGQVLTDAEAAELSGGSSSSCNSVIIVQTNGVCHVEQSAGCAPELAAAAVMKARAQVLEALECRQGAFGELESLLQGMC